MESITRIRFTVAYDGTDFCGWQKQSPQNVPKSIADTIEEALARIFSEKISLMASGRTDSGVHALNQVCHFDTKKNIESFKNWDFCWAIKSYLPPSIVIKKAWVAPSDFHATISATHKTYRYIIVNRDRCSPFLVRYAEFIRKPLDIDHLNRGAQFLVGEHDFKSFQSTGSHVRTTVRQIYQAFWERRSNGVLYFTVTGNGFLKQMVRNIVGTSLNLEKKGINPEFMRDILLAKDRSRAGAPASPKGLFLARVYYPKELDNKCIEL